MACLRPNALAAFAMPLKGCWTRATDVPTRASTGTTRRRSAPDYVLTALANSGRSRGNARLS